MIIVRNKTNRNKPNKFIMRHLSITIVALLSMGLLQTSCSQNRGNVDVAPSLTVDSVGVEHEDSVGEFRISADFASGSDAVLVNSINEYIMETLNGQYPGEYMDFKAMLDFCLAEKVKEYHNDWKEMEVHLSGMHYLYDTSISLTYEGPRFVTYTNTCETFMGGAHGLYSAKVWPSSPRVGCVTSLMSEHCPGS